MNKEGPFFENGRSQGVMAISGLTTLGAPWPLGGKGGNKETRKQGSHPLSNTPLAVNGLANFWLGFCKITDGAHPHVFFINMSKNNFETILGESRPFQAKIRQECRNCSDFFDFWNGNLWTFFLRGVFHEILLEKEVHPPLSYPHRGGYR